MVAHSPVSKSHSDGTGLAAAGVTPRLEESFAQMKGILREMFQLERGDLDFGLYRIMALKAGEIETFLNHDLLPQVRCALNEVSDEERATLDQELVKARQKAHSLGVDPETTPKVMALKEQLAKAKAGEEAEADVYRHLANFFARYYCEGDFLSLRRYTSGGRSTYLIPYDGEEVKLHWANADQYYIKTTENYAAYAFTIGAGETQRHIRFEISAADNEKDNIKEARDKKRRFVLSNGDKAISHDHSHLLVCFEHRPLSEAEKKTWPGNGNGQQDKIDRDSTSRILRALDGEWQLALSALAPTEADPARTVLAKHIGCYTAKNSFDYFIHKDLGGFLRRELDLYLKTDVLNLEDLSLGDTDRLRRGLMRMRATRHVGHKLIDFLAQLENFQKKLWLKKKFVLETQWCVTLDRVPEALYGQIAANEAQRQEWVELLAIDAITPDLSNGGVGYSEPLTSDFLKANPYLVLDTRHFDRDFKDQLLAALSEIGPLDEQTDGLLIHGENFQALNLLKERYREQVQCVYIDPPYNSNTSEILYKNGYKHSSWICMMDNRLEVSSKFATDTGSHIVAIDENEQISLGHLLKQRFPTHTHTNICVSIVHNKKGIQGKYLSHNHDFSYFSISNALQETHDKLIPKNDQTYTSLRKWGRESERSTARNCFFPIYVRDGEIVGFGDVCDDGFHPGLSNIKTSDGRLAVYPLKDGERKWRYARSSIDEIAHLLRARTIRNGEVQIEKANEKQVIKTVWHDPKYIAGDHGTRWLTDLGLKVQEDLYPKSIYTVEDSIRLSSEINSLTMDYFAGSGTTGHAVINLNGEDGGQRKYILVEMGEHFDTVILPRLKKVIYAPEWKNGKPVAHGNGSSHLIKVMRLESYEDTLDGLVLKPPKDDLFADSPELAEDYRLRYALGAETSNSPCLLGGAFADPFAYTLSVVRNGIRRETPADLPETFNYLLGLRVEARRHHHGVLAILGKDPQKRSCLILWRNLTAVDNPALEHWFANNRELLPESLDRIYVNGDQTLNAIRQAGETWTAETIEPLFRKLMVEANEP